MKNKSLRLSILIAASLVWIALVLAFRARHDVLGAAGVGVAGGRATVTIENGTGYSAVVHLAFGADSKVLPAALPFCLPSGALTCAFPLAAHAEQSLPLEIGRASCRERV